MRALLYLLVLGSTLAPACQPKQSAPVKRAALAPAPLLLHLTQLVARQTLTPDTLDRLTGNKGDYRAGRVGGAPVLFVGWGDLNLRTDSQTKNVSLHIAALNPDPPVPAGQPGRWGRLPYTLPALRAQFGPWKEDHFPLTKDEDSRTYAISFPYQDPQTGRRACVQALLDSPDRSAQAVIYSIDVTPDSK